MVEEVLMIVAFLFINTAIAGLGVVLFIKLWEVLEND